MSTAHHAASGDNLWLFLIWGWIIISCGGEWIAGKYDMGVRAIRRRRAGRRKHELKLKKLELQIAQELRGPLRPALTLEEEDALAGRLPGPCPHRPRNVKPVFDALGDHRAYLCTACDTQLPKDWAVLEEDL